MAFAVAGSLSRTMEAAAVPHAKRPLQRSDLFDGLLRGYAFRVCADERSVQAALSTRAAVYAEECGYDVPIPDQYDSRSWFLVAEETNAGTVVGSLRVTPRAAGPIEAEEYFSLPKAIARCATVEMSRFAVRAEHRHGTRFLPAVALGLFKLAGKFLERLATDYVVICSRPERVLSYQWLRFEPSGQRAPYGKLGNLVHELMVCDVRGGPQRHRDHRYWDCFFEVHHPEIQLGDAIPGLGPRCARTAPVGARKAG